MDLQNFLQEDLIPWLLSHGIKIVCILIGAYFINLFGRILIKKAIRKTIRGKDEIAEKKREDTLISVFNNTSKITIWIIAILMILPELGINIGPLLAGVGLIGLAIGMAARDTISDFLNGFFIVLQDRYRIGDKIKIAGVEGQVLEIKLGQTILKDSEGTIYVIPNSQIKISANKSQIRR